MKKRTMKLAALAMSATMLLGNTMTVFGAEDPNKNEESAPIYSYDVSTVVVPTKLTVAFNPNGYEVDVDEEGDGEAVKSEVISLNYGMLSKSDKAKQLTVALQVTDPNNLIKFVDTAAEVEKAEDDTYVIFLQASPITVTTTGMTLNTEAGITAINAEVLANVEGEATSGADEITLNQNGKLGFNLKAATFTQTAIDLMSQETNDVSTALKISEVTADSFGGFTFTGAMNNNTNWALIKEPIKISAVYSWETIYDTTSVQYGVAVVDKAPTFTAGTNKGVITVDKGIGDNGLASIYSITMNLDGVDYDVYNVAGELWGTATTSEDGTTITLTAEAMKFWETAGKVEAKITYITNAGEAKVITVENVLTK